MALSRLSNVASNGRSDSNCAHSDNFGESNWQWRYYSNLNMFMSFLIVVVQEELGSGGLLCVSGFVRFPGELRFKGLCRGLSGLVPQSIV